MAEKEAKRGTRVSIGIGNQQSQAKREENEIPEEREWKEKEGILSYWFLLEQELRTTISKGNMKYAELAKARIDFLKEKVDREWKEKEGILSYWFLVEQELRTTISKVNMKYAELAKARIDFLKEKVDPVLLEEGIKGNEEALCDIHSHLHNSGWWEKARKLNIRKLGLQELKSTTAQNIDDEAILDFIISKKDFVHPNIIKDLNKRNDEDIRMALNQIHYGTLKVAREVSRQKPVREEEFLSHKPKALKEDQGFRVMSSSLQVVLEIIINHKNLINPNVYSEALNLNDESISAVLWQIHQLSLNGSSSHPVKQNLSYKQALLSPRSPSPTERSISSKVHSKIKPRVSNSIFFAGFPVNLMDKDIWQFFKSGGKIKDIILPKKRDKNNNRYGFVILDNRVEGANFIATMKDKKLGGHTIYLAFAKKQSKQPIKEEAHKPEFLNIEPPRSRSKASIFLSPETKSPSQQSEKKISPRLENHVSKSHKSLPLNEVFYKELESCLLLETINRESIESVAVIVEGLGFENVEIKGISSRAFLAYFPDEDTNKIDIGFLEIGFAKVRNPELTDLIPWRKTWVECRGLPIVVWLEENFKVMLKDWGEVLYISKFVDEDGYFVAPKILIETSEQSRIEKEDELLIHNKFFKFTIFECESNIWSPDSTNSLERDGFESNGIDQFSEEKAMDQANSLKREQNIFSGGVVDESASLHLEERDQTPCIEVQELPDLILNPLEATEGVIPDFEDSLCERENTKIPGICLEDHLVDTTEEREESNSLVNPMTPRQDLGLSKNVDFLKDSWGKWDTRESNFSISSSFSSISSISRGNLICKDEGDVINCLSNSSILKELGCLKLRSNRGRPRKKPLQKENKYFKVPSNKKKKKMKKGEADSIAIKWLDRGEGVDEAEAILETGLHMGLVLVKDNDSSLKLIKENLHL